MSTTGIEEMQRIILGTSIKFFNINKLMEPIFFGEKCNGCDASTIAKQDMLIKKACCAVSDVVSVLVATSETLLCSSCITGEVKISLAKDIRCLAYDVKFFLMVRSHVINSNLADKRVSCECNHHKNIEILTEIFVSIIHIK